MSVIKGLNRLVVVFALVLLIPNYYYANEKIRGWEFFKEPYLLLSRDGSTFYHDFKKQIQIIINASKNDKIHFTDLDDGKDINNFTILAKNRGYRWGKVDMEKYKQVPSWQELNFHPDLVSDGPGKMLATPTTPLLLSITIFGAVLLSFIIYVILRLSMLISAWVFKGFTEGRPH